MYRVDRAGWISSDSQLRASVYALARMVPAGRLILASERNGTNIPESLFEQPLSRAKIIFSQRRLLKGRTFQRRQPNFREDTGGFQSTNSPYHITAFYGDAFFSESPSPSPTKIPIRMKPRGILSLRALKFLRMTVLYRDNIRNGFIPFVSTAFITDIKLF